MSPWLPVSACLRRCASAKRNPFSPMKEPILILSDLHLGHKVSRLSGIEALRPLVAGAGTIVFNGDTWQELARDWRVRSAEMLEELRWMCAEEETDAVFLSGNHDPGWSGPGWLELGGGKIIITHGDALLHSGAPWKREILMAAEQVEALWGQFPGADHDPEARLRLAREISRQFRSRKHPKGRRIWERAWDAIVPPQRGVRMIEAWLTQGKLGAAFMERYFPQAEVLIIGHFHWAGSWLEKGRRILNTGSFLNPGPAHFIEWNDGCLTRGVIVEKPDACTKGKILDVWRV